MKNTKNFFDEDTTATINDAVDGLIEKFTGLLNKET
jgi:hypothetical protein